MYKTLGERGGCWPTPLQELLLKAIVLHDNAAHSAWKEWISSVEVENLDWGSYRLLPLLYRNLNELGINDPVMKKFKGVYRYTWCKNQVLFAAVSRLLRSFNEAGIKTMALKGPALVLLNYGDYGLRPMDDFDILVHTDKATDAMNLLKESGWDPVETDFPETLISKTHGTPFKNSSGLNLDLQWHIFEDKFSNASDDNFWSDAIPTEVNGVPTLALNPADQMLHAFVHGIRWNAAPPFRWVADVMSILETSKTSFDWNRLLVKTREHRVVLPVRSGLSYIQNTFGAAVPREILQALRNEPVTRKEALWYDIQTRPFNKYGMKRLRFIYTQYQRYLKREVGDETKDKILSFPRFVKDLWGVDHYWEIPRCAFNKTAQRIFVINKFNKEQKFFEKGQKNM